jgi:1-acyl-sn-glycerol-3-phosphate acyltransferase
MAEQDRGVAGIFYLPYRVFVAVWLVISSIVYCLTVICLAPIAPVTAKRVGRLWMSHLLFFSGVTVKTIGGEKLDRAGRYVVIANHQSYFDIPVLSVGLPFFLSFIAKKGLFLIPIFGWGMAAIGHIWINRDNARAARKSITRAIAKLNKEAISLVLFPEGTRSLDGELGPFKRASFTLAIESGVSVVPVAIVGIRSILAKRSLRLKPGAVHLVVGDPIPAPVVVGLDKKALSELIREKMIAQIEEGKAGIQAHEMS